MVISGNTTEIFKDGSWTNGPTLPISVSPHRPCATKFNSSHTLITGGRCGTCALVLDSSSKESLKWIEVAPMATGRSYHSCATLSNGSVIVANGDPKTKSVEIYNP